MPRKRLVESTEVVNFKGFGEVQVVGRGKMASREITRRSIHDVVGRVPDVVADKLSIADVDICCRCCCSRRRCLIFVLCGGAAVIVILER